MKTDEEQIRELVHAWMEASKRGDTDAILALMTDDVVFLQPGREPMNKEGFAAASRAQADGSAPKMDGSSEIQELVIAGDWAFMRSRLTVIASPPDGSDPIRRTGHTLTVFKKEDGSWLLARDANLLGPGSSTA